MKEVDAALAEVGFKREKSRYFTRSDCPYFIEFVSPPAAIGSEPIKGSSELKTRLGTVVLLTATDSVKDRLAAFYHWNDPQALEQAIMVAKAQEINFSEVKRWSKKEGHPEKYLEFLKKLQNK